MLAFGWNASELRPEIQSVRAKLNVRICGRDAFAAAHAVMLANSARSEPNAIMFTQFFAPLPRPRSSVWRRITNPGGRMPISVGQAAPEFTLKDQSQKEVKLADFKGKKNVVMVFYPLDWSPVCTNEHACFVNDMKKFESLDAQVLGVSVDSVWSHKAYAEKMGIQYPLLADFQPRGAVADKFGVFLADKGITGRAIAIIDKQGKVAWFKQYDIPAVPDLNEVSAALSQVK
jgi:mycoredoxin-dependent peroxiredoxin